MKRWISACAFVLCAPACASSASPTGPLATTTSAIEDGTVDSTDTFAVAVVQQSNQLVFCSGVLLAPNLVATARHCVAELASEEIDCSTATFGSVLPLTDFGVSTVTQLSPRSTFVGVSKIVVPSAADQTKVCGDDLALMILDRSIILPQYVEPVIDPPMTDHSLYSTEIAAIGYGLSTPTDEAGVSAGVRRIKQNVNLTCIPNDPNFADCFSNPVAKTLMTAGEFISGDDSTCEGDSGSGAFEQSNFTNGKWVAFGVLSRGGVSSDGQTCIQPIYTRFDAWGSLLTQTAIEAASIGGYAAPSWAGGSTTGSSGSSGSTSASGDGAASLSSDAAGASSGAAPAGLGDGVTCNLDSDCQSGKCVSVDDQNFYCASACDGTSCPTSFSCQLGYCFPATTGSSSTLPATSGSTSKGCTVAAPSKDSSPPSIVAAFLMLAGLAGRRRRA